MTGNDPHVPHTTQEGSKKSRAPLITSIVLASLVVLAAISLVFFGTLKKGSPETGSESPEAGSSSALAITSVGPKGLQSGGIIFSSDFMPVSSPGIEPGQAPIMNSVDRASGEVDVVIYVDYRCPHCQAFEHANLEVIEEALGAGNATVEVRPLTFMDRYSEGSAYSSRAAALMACSVEHQPEISWTIHNLLLSPTVQPVSAGPAYTNEQLLDIVDIVTDGTNGNFKNCVLNNTYVEFAGAVNDWTFANPVAFANDPSLAVQGTPLILVAGDVYTGDIENPAQFRSFLKEQGVKLD